MVVHFQLTNKAGPRTSLEAPECGWEVAWSFPLLYCKGRPLLHASEQTPAASARLTRQQHVQGWQGSICMLPSRLPAAARARLTRQQRVHGSQGSSKHLLCAQNYSCMP
eukprot:1155397-Pelagomonas_calceolata.AAC.4